MKPECEMTVSRHDFEAAMLAPEGVGFDAGRLEYFATRLSPVTGGVRIATPWQTSELGGDGR